MGLSPTRCGSVVHSSTVAWGKACWSAFTCSGSFFKRLLSGCVGFGVPRTQHPLAVAQAFEILPAALGMHFAPGVDQDPLGHFATGPESPIWGRFLQSRDELRLQLG